MIKDAKQELLNRLKEKKQFILAGNREFFSILEFRDNSFFILNGDSFSNQITDIQKISDKEVIKIVVDYFNNQSKVFENKEVKTPEQAIEFWDNWLDKEPE